VIETLGEFLDPDVFLVVVLFAFNRGGRRRSS
jgi:hypothetical protein